jgi:hypothetical protein
MKLGQFLKAESVLGDKYEAFEKLRQHLIESGVPENLATYKASEVLTPNKLEQIKVVANTRGGHAGKGVVFFFKKDEDIELLNKFFHLYHNGREPQVGDSSLLIELLKLMEVVNG